MYFTKEIFKKIGLPSSALEVDHSFLCTIFPNKSGSERAVCFMNEMGTLPSDRYRQQENTKHPFIQSVHVVFLVKLNFVVWGVQDFLRIITKLVYFLQYSFFKTISTFCLR